MFKFKINREDLTVEEFKAIVQGIKKECSTFDYGLRNIRGFNFSSSNNGLNYVIESVNVSIERPKPGETNVKSLYKAIDYLDGVVVLEGVKCKSCNNSLRYTEFLDYENGKCEYCQD